MAYGDACEQHPRIPWEEFESSDYFYRLEDLQRGWFRTFDWAPDTDEAAMGRERERLYRELEECALEFVAYRASLRLARE
jgi:hypothetical protein